MTKREIASLAIKLMGVFILLKSIAYVPSVFSVMRSEGLLLAVFIVIISIVMAVIPLAWSLLVIFLSDKIAAWLIKDNTSAGTIGTSISKDDVMMMAVSCIGLYFIIAAMPSLIINLSFYFRPSASSFWQNAFRTLVAPAVQLGLGVWLFAGSKGIVKLWKKIRS